MDDYYEIDEFDEYDESDESFGEYEDMSEAKKKPRIPKQIKSKTVKNPYTPRLTGQNQPVLDGQLRVITAKMTQQIADLQKAQNAMQAEQRKFAVDIRRTQDGFRKSLDMERKKADKLRTDLRTTQTISALLPFLAKPGTKFGSVAPLVHLVSNDLLSGLGGGTGSNPGALGSANNIALLAGVAYASGILD